MNARLRSRNAGRNPVILSLEARPKLDIDSFDPLIYNTYGIFRNKAPHLAGDFILRQLLIGPHPDGNAQIYLGVENGQKGYGIRNDSVNLLNRLATHLGSVGYFHY